MLCLLRVFNFLKKIWVAILKTCKQKAICSYLNSSGVIFPALHSEQKIQKHRLLDPLIFGVLSSSLIVVLNDVFCFNNYKNL